ncbi:MAG: membrane dipeptidase [Pseudomonadota bacterium]
MIIDGLQYVNWNRQLFAQARDAGVNAIHVTVAYWENSRDALFNIGQWRRHFTQHADLIHPVRDGADLDQAIASGRLGIILGFQNCSPIEDDLRMVASLHELGVRVMQLSYNNQSLLATGCYEQRDSGVTRFGCEVIKEMNRVGMLIDMSHSAELSTLEAIELSERPIAITHANPSSFHAAIRNKSDTVLRQLAQSGGMLGTSLYPFHLRDGSACTLESFCQMVYDTANLMGIDHIGIGSDLCQNWDYSTLEWMRSGRWAAQADYGEGSAENSDWPAQPAWFRSSQDFPKLAEGLANIGFNPAEVTKIMGGNWHRFFSQSFSAATPATQDTAQIAVS